MRMRGSTLLLGAALAALTLSATAPLAAGPEVVGHVATVFGDAVARRPGETPRPLECGAPVFDGEQVETGQASRVGLLLGDVLHNLGETTTLALTRTPEGASDVRLERGSVRVLDPRESGALAGLSVLDARAAVLGNDAEAYVFAEKVGRYALICEWDAPLAVERGSERAQVEPGQCVFAKPREPLYLADAHEDRMGTPADDFCELGPLFALDDRFSPADVAAGLPSLFSPLLPGPPETGPRSPCDDPGSGCAGVVGGAGGMVGVPPPSGGPGGGIGGTQGNVGVPPPSGGPGGGIGLQLQ